MSNTTRAQREAMLKVYQRHIKTGSYRAFRRTVINDTLAGCLMVNVSGMWLGIETDGYTHS